MKIHHVGEGAARELKLEVTLDAPREAVWRSWTEPALLKEWHCPKPWLVAEAYLDVRPGGRFNAVFAGPNGERRDHKGVYLEVAPMERLTFTDGHREGYIPAEKHFMTGYVVLSDAPGGGTRMVWGARHASQADLKTHLAMGFAEGWQAAAGQLEALAQSLAQQKRPSSNHAKREDHA